MVAEKGHARHGSGVWWHPAQRPATAGRGASAGRAVEEAEAGRCKAGAWPVRLGAGRVRMGGPGRCKPASSRPASGCGMGVGDAMDSALEKANELAHDQLHSDALGGSSPFDSSDALSDVLSSDALYNNSDAISDALSSSALRSRYPR